VSEGSFASPEFMQALQVVQGTLVHMGTSLMTSGGEPVVGRSLLLEIDHHANLTQIESTTHFGLSQHATMNLSAQLLIGIALAYGEPALTELLNVVAQALEDGTGTVPATPM
jgi:hypothetical protein